MPAPVLLRPYQVDLLEKARAEIRAGRRRFILQLGTGGGKTRVFAELIRLSVAKGNRCLVVAHRRELVEQASAKLDDVDVPHGVVMAGHPRWRPHEPVQVASRDTLVARLGKPDFDIGEFQLIVCDEAHHASSASSLFIIERWPKAVLVGPTATPIRTDNRPLGTKYREDNNEDGTKTTVKEYELFQSIICGPSILKLTEVGALVPFHGFAYDMPALDGIKKNSGGDYNLAMLDDVMKETVLGGSVVRDFIEHARGLRALAFAVSVEHSKALAAQARDAGVSAEHVDANTPLDIRAGLFGPRGRLATGETMFVSNVGIATEGTDCPAIECLVLARPTASMGLALQMVGRALRPWCFTCSDAPAPGCGTHGHRIKNSARIHDHAGVMPLALTVLDAEDFPWSLDDHWQMPRAVPTKTCKKCLAIVVAGTTVCPRCGAVFEVTEGIRKEIVEDDTKQRLTIEELRARRPHGTKDLDDAELRKVHGATREQKIGEFLRLRAIRDEKGLKEKFPDAAFRGVFGHWPKFTDAELADAVPADKPFLKYRPKQEA